MPDRVPYVNLPGQMAPLEERALEAVRKVFRHGYFILGPEVRELEDRIAAELGLPHVVGVNSGTDALLLALRIAGVGRGHDVLTVSHSFVATASAICLAGANPVFVDLDPRTMLMDPEKLEAALTRETRAVMPVHLNGHPCDMEPIVEFCRAHGLQLIEDCAQAFGMRHRGLSAGGWGIGCFSLHPLKGLSACGDAGFISVHDEGQADELRRLRNIGLIDRDHCGLVSGNSRLDTVQAAILLVKLDAFPAWLETRRAHAQAYREALAGAVTLPPEDAEGDRSVYSAFVVRHPDRDRIMADLNAQGLDVKAHYPLAIHQQEAFRCLPAGDLPVTEQVVNEILSLPVTPELTEDGRGRVIEGLLAEVAGG